MPRIGSEWPEMGRNDPICCNILIMHTSLACRSRGYPDNPSVMLSRIVPKISSNPPISSGRFRIAAQIPARMPSGVR